MTTTTTDIQSELETLREQLSNFQTVVAVLTKRAGGRIYIPEEELEHVVGHGIKMVYEDDGILLSTASPQVELDVDAPYIHAIPHCIQ
jgi:hypothetical protein